MEILSASTGRDGPHFPDRPTDQLPRSSRTTVRPPSLLPIGATFMPGLARGMGPTPTMTAQRTTEVPASLAATRSVPINHDKPAMTVARLKEVNVVTQFTAPRTPARACARHRTAVTLSKTIHGGLGAAAKPSETLSAGSVAAHLRPLGFTVQFEPLSKCPAKLP